MAANSSSFGPDLSAAAIGGEGIGTKRRKEQSGRAAGSEGDPRLRAVLDSFGTLARLSLSNANEIRSIKAIVITSIALPTSHRFAVLMLAAQQQYSTKTKGQKGHGQGIPEFWAWRAMTQAALEASDENGKNMMEEHIKGLGDAKAFKGKVGQCVCKKAYGDGRARIEVAVASEWQGILKHIIGLLEADPLVEVHEGRAPRGHNERVLSEVLNKIEKD